MMTGGEGEIRTHGTREGTTVFETVPIDHSGTSPREARYSIRNTKGKLAGRVPEECRRTHQMGLEGEPAWHGAWIPALAERPSQPIGRKAPSRSPLAAPRSPFAARLPGRVFRCASLQRLKLLGTASRLVISGSNARGAIPRTF